MLYINPQVFYLKNKSKLPLNYIDNKYSTSRVLVDLRGGILVSYHEGQDDSATTHSICFCMVNLVTSEYPRRNMPILASQAKRRS